MSSAQERKRSKEKRKKSHFVYKWMHERKREKTFKNIAANVFSFYFYMSEQIRFPVRLPFWLRPPLTDDRLPLVPFPPFLFFRPFRSLRVRSFWRRKKQEDLALKSIEINQYLHISWFLVRECRRLLRHLAESSPTFGRMASIMMQQNLEHKRDQLYELVNRFYFPPLESSNVHPRELFFVC